jgi:hypothetical protein
MKLFFVGSLFLLCAVATAFCGVQQIGFHFHYLGLAMIGVSFMSIVFLSRVEDLLVRSARHD